MRTLPRWNQLLLPSLLLSSFLLAASEKPQEPVTTLPSHTITPAVAPAVNVLNVTTTADFIWWKTYLGNMEYAWGGVVDLFNVSQLQSASKGNIKNPDFDFAPGFKLGLGFTFNHDGWDLYARYTWLHGNTNSHTVANTSSGLMATFPDAPLNRSFFAVNEAKVHWEQNFNVLDLELGRNFFISKTLSLRPFIGLKSDWILEKFHDHYVFSANFTEDVYRKERVWGFGIRGGLNSVWHFFKNFGLYGDMAATALWSDFHSTIRQHILSSLQSTNELNSYQKTQQVMPVLEAGLGLIYQLWFNNEKDLFFAKAGWEGQIWFDYNQIIQPPTVAKCGNLSLHGLTVEVGFTF